MRSFDEKKHSGGATTILAIICLVIVIVGVITYSMYLFVDATRISDLANIHVTKNFILAAQEMRGKLYSNPEKGIKDWVIYTDKENGFEIKYPNEWELQKGVGKTFIFIKDFGVKNKFSNAIAVNVAVGKTDKSLEEIANQEGFVSNGQWKEEILDERKVIRMQKAKTKDGLFRDMVIFERENGDVMFVESTYFNENSADAEKTFDLMLSEFKLI